MKNDINSLVEKLIASNWGDMSFEVFNKLVDKTNEEMDKILKIAHIKEPK